MKIQITEKQLSRLRNVISEATSSVDKLNNMIDVNDFFYDKDSVEVKFDSILIEGDITDDDLHVYASINKITYRKKDVTDFALSWAIKDAWTSDDLPLGVLLSMHISELLNKRILSLVGASVSEYDVTLE